MVPSKPILQESIITLVAIDHQMEIIHVQVRKNFIENVLLDGGFEIKYYNKEVEGTIKSVKTKTCTL
jgi:hypothetical protein